MINMVSTTTLSTTSGFSKAAFQLAVPRTSWGLWWFQGQVPCGTLGLGDHHGANAGAVLRAALSLKATTPRLLRGPRVYKSRRALCRAYSLRSAMALLWLLSCLALAGSARAAFSVASAWGRGWAG